MFFEKFQSFLKINTKHKYYNFERYMFALYIAIRHLNKGSVIDDMFPCNKLKRISDLFNAILQIMYRVAWMFHPITDNISHKCQT